MRTSSWVTCPAIPYASPLIYHLLSLGETLQQSAHFLSLTVGTPLNSSVAPHAPSAPTEPGFLTFPLPYHRTLLYIQRETWNILPPYPPKTYISSPLPIFQFRIQLYIFRKYRSVKVLSCQLSHYLLFAERILKFSPVFTSFTCPCNTFTTSGWNNTGTFPSWPWASLKNVKRSLWIRSLRYQARLPSQRRASNLKLFF